MGDVAVPPSSDSRSPLSPASAGSKTSSIAALAIAVIGAALMIDLAVETFIGGSVLRWWAVAAAAAYLGLAVAARRMDVRWNSQLTIVVVFALGVAAATAWRPAGLANGIRVAGQPTSRVLSALTAVALIVAIVTILRATILPLAGRLVVSLLALYGLAAFALGAWQTTPYQALFAGDSMWRALPRWLQGGVIGGLVALPLALLVALAGGLTRGKRTWQLQSIVTFALTIAIAFSAFRNGAPFDLSASGDAREAQTQPDAREAQTQPDAREAQTQPDPRALADVSTLLKRIADTPEPSTFNVEKTADEIGSDPALLFAYVHDHVRTQIYSGVLRGARGTLMGGAGNAWDQALLLGAMLRHQGREVRFAHAHLTPDIAARIVDRMFTDAGRPRAPAGQSLPIPDSVQAGSKATLKQIQKDWQSAQADLLKALDRADLSLGSAATSEQTLESEAADHLFVEYHDGDRWVPLDPVAAVSPGASAASEGETFPEVPDAFYHHVTIRVKIEERHDQKLAQEEIFRFPTTAAALNGEQVVLVHRFDHDIQGGWRATPVLQIGDQAYGARTFAHSGLIAAKANSKEDLIGQAHETVGQLGKVTDAFSSGNAQSPSTPAAAEFTAESLEVEFVDPAQHSEIVRREIIDRIGPVARANNTAASAPLTPTTIGNDVPLEMAGIYALAFAVGPLNPTLPLRRLSSTQGLIEDAEALRHVQPSQNVSLSSEDQQRMGRVLNKFPVLLQTSAESILALSQHVAQSLRVRGVPALFYESTPRLVIASFDLTSGLALDLRRNTLRAVARKVSASDLVRANVARSVADAVIEGDVLRLKAERRRIAAVDIFDRARAEGIRLVTARSGAALPVQASDLARARMASAEPGSLLIAPERTPSANPSHFAWWKLNPSTGEAISTLDTGLNGFQDLAEEGVIETRVISPMAKTLRPEAFSNTLGAGRMANGALTGMGPVQDIATGIIDALVELGQDIDLDLMGDFY
jgi:transglutaminase-like putative cysteine protease